MRLIFLSQTSDFWRPIEDGSNTQYRLAVIESLIPPRSDGPIVHFHEMHDEGFFVTVSKMIIDYGLHRSGTSIAFTVIEILY